jgi:Protein of unknown function (DUF3455)
MFPMLLMSLTFKRTVVVVGAMVLGACGALSADRVPPVSVLNARPNPVAAIPSAIAVPAGHSRYLTLQSAGEVAYECRANGYQDGFEWGLLSASATLYEANAGAGIDRLGSPVGTYASGPTWEVNDGSRITGKLIAISSVALGDIPLQLVQANPSMGKGVMQGVTYVQRLNTRGGVAPHKGCDQSTVSTQVLVKYQADYIFYKG